MYIYIYIYMCYATHNIPQLCTNQQSIHLRTGNKKHILYIIYYLYLRTSYKTVLGGTTIEKANTIMMIMVVVVIVVVIVVVLLLIIIIIILIIIDFLQTHTIKQHPNTHRSQIHKKKQQHKTTPHHILKTYLVFLVETYSHTIHGTGNLCLHLP